MTSPRSISDALPDVRPRCPKCGRPLKVLRLEIAGRMRDCCCWGSCGCAASAETLERMRPRTKVGAYERAGIPERYRGAEPISATEEAEVAANAARCAAGGWLYISGPVGDGKTRRAALVAKRLVDDGARVRFVSARDLVESRYGDAQSLATLMSCDVLVLDDLGKEHPSVWSTGVVFEVVDERYRDRRSLVVTTNFAPAELGARISSDKQTAMAVMSRIAGECERVDMPDRDMRVAARRGAGEGRG